MRITVPVRTAPSPSRSVPVRIRSGRSRGRRVIRLERLHRVEDIVFILRAAAHN